MYLYMWVYCVALLCCLLASFFLLQHSLPCTCTHSNMCTTTPSAVSSCMHTVLDVQTTRINHCARSFSTNAKPHLLHVYCTSASMTSHSANHNVQYTYNVYIYMYIQEYLGSSFLMPCMMAVRISLDCRARLLGSCTC